LADYLAAQLAGLRLPDWSWGGLDLLVPVPLHPRRLAERGFDQAALLATGLGPRLGIRVELGALVRSRYTPAQAQLASRAQRHKNVAGAFQLRRPERVAGRAVCLVDDVATTGATLDACAQVLVDAGVRSVRAVSLARTPLGDTSDHIV